MNLPLSLKTLTEINIDTPSYDRNALQAGIVHFGVGNFHRAHQSIYLDELFSLGFDHDWAIIGAGVRPGDVDMRQKLESQDWLTTVIARDATHQHARITGAMIDFIDPDKPKELIATLADPKIRIVSLTVTEGGYFVDPASGKFNPDHPEIIHDAQNIDQPKTVFGIILAGLMARRDNNIPPFTIMSCDNLPGNGHVATDAVAGLAELFDPDLAAWVREKVAFPNAMVDRITPATSDKERQLVVDDYGFTDNWPVACETFRQWVIEDNFPAGRPAFEKVGATFVEDVAPYETMKIRILNGGHAAIAYPAGLMDIHFVDEAMENPLITGFLNKLEIEEIIPIVPPIPGVDLAAYFTQITKRFSNPTVGDTIRRLCLDGSNRQPKFILPSASDRLAQNQSVIGLALVSALWCRYCFGTTESGSKIAPNDPDWDRLQSYAIKAKENPAAFLEMGDIFGSLANEPSYVTAFSKALESIWDRGTKTTLELYLADKL